LWTEIGVACGTSGGRRRYVSVNIIASGDGPKWHVKKRDID
jgi:hypothetical protein